MSKVSPGWAGIHLPAERGGGGKGLYLQLMVPPCLAAMQFGQLLAHLDTTQQLIAGSLKDNSALLAQVSAEPCTAPPSFLPPGSSLTPFSPAGAEDHEGEPGSCGGQLCWH